MNMNARRVLDTLETQSGTFYLSVCTAYCSGATPFYSIDLSVPSYSCVAVCPNNVFYTVKDTDHSVHVNLGDKVCLPQAV
jgi:hypothetical protein